MEWCHRNIQLWQVDQTKYAIWKKGKKNEPTQDNRFYKHLFLTGCRNSSNKDTILFKNIGVFCDLAFNVLFCLLGELDLNFLLGITQLGLFLPFLLQGGGDGLVLPANFMGQSSKQGKLEKSKLIFLKGPVFRAKIYGVSNILELIAKVKINILYLQLFVSVGSAWSGFMVIKLILAVEKHHWQKAI